MASSAALVRVLGALFIVFLAAALRIIPHPPNFTPVAAMALFGGAYLGRPLWAFAATFLALALSDAYLGFHDQMLAVYLSFGLVVALGAWLRPKRSVATIALASVSGSVLFFVITNFAIWAQTGMYPRTWEGLAFCYTAALPFLQNSLMGDLFFNAVFFGGWALARATLPGMAPEAGGNGR